jgi:hypothetical protein
LSENALKLTYGNVEFQNFPGEDPRPPLQGEGKDRARRRSSGREDEEWGEGGEDELIGDHGSLVSKLLLFLIVGLSTEIW